MDDATLRSLIDALAATPGNTALRIAVMRGLHAKGNANAADYVRSMERLLALPVRVVHGGHFPSFDGARHRRLITGWLEAKGRRTT